MTLPVIPVPDILARRSIRQYTDQPISDDQLKTLLMAAMSAPSARDEQPWHFVVVTDRAVLDQLAERHPSTSVLKSASLVIAVCADLKLMTTGIPDYWIQDCSAATSNLLLAATGMGLGACWLGVHPRSERVDAVRDILELPGHVMPLNLITVGYPAEEKPPRTHYNPARIHRDRW